MIHKYRTALALLFTRDSTVAISS